MNRRISSSATSLTANPFARATSWVHNIIGAWWHDAQPISAFQESASDSM